MSAEGNKAILRDAYDAVFTRHELHRADEFYAANYLDPGVLPQPGGLEGTKQSWASALVGVPDLRVAIVELIAEADKVAVSWSLEGTHLEDSPGLPVTERPVRFTGLALYRLAAGRIVEFVAGTSPMSSLRVGVTQKVIADRSTERSKALLDEVVRLVPEIDEMDRPRLFDFEFAHEPRKRQVIAGADRTYPGLGQITVHIAVSSPGRWRLPCTPGSTGDPCTRIEDFADGSTAYLRTYTVPGTVGHAYDVTLVKPDGTGISVSSAAYRPEHADMPDAPLSLDRVLEIARQITITP
ncbi:putative ester cyclase [Kribbella amoyensis]|uniref:Putative ester cyclase n=1 Tax=Kribbella amoyensis TaxID=996641 RepID=A0A561BMA2_9ACTN|nr:ester cyclase [Kribbella amoyensis]TWD80020.1 putative ester cyclase [Kribbella amoyensis]